LSDPDHDRKNVRVKTKKDIKKEEEKERIMLKK
jgi:hypothetical protein